MDPTKVTIDQLVDELAVAFDQARQGRNPAREDLERFVRGLLEAVPDRSASPAPRRRSEAKRPSTPEGA